MKFEGLDNLGIQGEKPHDRKRKIFPGETLLTLPVVFLSVRWTNETVIGRKMVSGRKVSRRLLSGGIPGARTKQQTLEDDEILANCSREPQAFVKKLEMVKHNGGTDWASSESISERTLKNPKKILTRLT